jgi:heme-degrading monooxygenase HmoA
VLPFTDRGQEIVLVSYKVKIAVAVEKIGEFLDFCHSIANEFRHEKGYRVLHVYRDREDSDTFILISEWESEKSLIIGEAVTIDNSRWQRLNLPW